MSRGVNKVILVGHVGRDPEVRVLAASGSKVADFSLAATEQWKTRDGEKKERTEWVRIAAFGTLAEIVEKYVTKGTQLFCCGRLRTEKWQDKGGNDRYTTKVYLDEMTLLGGGNRADRPPRDDDRHPPVVTHGANAPDEDAEDDFDDDVPF